MGPEAYAVVERLMTQRGIGAREASKLAVGVMKAGYTGIFITDEAIRKKHRKVKTALLGGRKG